MAATVAHLVAVVAHSEAEAVEVAAHSEAEAVEAVSAHADNYPHPADIISSILKTTNV